MTKPITFAVPKGRISGELIPLLKQVDIMPEAAFFDEKSRLLTFATNHKDIRMIRVRSFDVATFIAFGGADIGVAGRDVLMEFDNPDIYAPLDLGIGKCRLSVAESAELANKDDPTSCSHIRVATKYPETTRRHFAKRGVQAECIKLNGAMELAPMMGLCRRIVDLVSTGKTLQENGLVEVEKIADITSLLIVNRVAYKTRNQELAPLIDRFRKAVAHG